MSLYAFVHLSIHSFMHFCICYLFDLLFDNVKLSFCKFSAFAALVVSVVSVVFWFIFYQIFLLIILFFYCIFLLRLQQCVCVSYYDRTLTLRHMHASYVSTHMSVFCSVTPLRMLFIVKPPANECQSAALGFCTILFFTNVCCCHRLLLLHFFSWFLFWLWTFTHTRFHVLLDFLSQKLTWFICKYKTLVRYGLPL